jgi:hypothetical protein
MHLPVNVLRKEVEIRRVICYSSIEGIGRIRLTCWRVWESIGCSAKRLSLFERQIQCGVHLRSPNRTGYHEGHDGRRTWQSTGTPAASRPEHIYSGLHWKIRSRRSMPAEGKIGASSAVAVARDIRQADSLSQEDGGV